MHERQFNRILKNISAVFTLHVNFWDFFEHVITPVRKPPENGLCLEIYPVYLADSETRIKFAMKITTWQNVP